MADTQYIKKTLYAGKYKIPEDIYYSVPKGWDVDSLRKKYNELGGVRDIGSKQQGSKNLYSYKDVLRDITDGINLHDQACIELAIRFIERRFIHFYSGYIRRKMARRLKHVSLTDQQRTRLSTHFLYLLQVGDRCEEFWDYVGLWHHVIQPNHLEEVKMLVGSLAIKQPSFASKLSAKLLRVNQ